MPEAKQEAKQEQSSDLHINRNRAISQLLREDREERKKAKLLAENRRLKSELSQLKHGASQGNADQS